MAATTVSIINLKGGVGKSTLTMILGEFLAFRHSKNAPYGYAPFRVLSA